MTPEAVPQTHCTDHLLEPAPSAGEGEKSADSEKEAEGKKEREKNSEESLVIFAVDISGSMCTTTEVPALQGKLCTVYSIIALH